MRKFFPSHPLSFSACATSCFLTTYHRFSRKIVPFSMQLTPLKCKIAMVSCNCHAELVPKGCLRDFGICFFVLSTYACPPIFVAGQDRHLFSLPVDLNGGSFLLAALSLRSRQQSGEARSIHVDCILLIAPIVIPPRGGGVVPPRHSGAERLARHFIWQVVSLRHTVIAIPTAVGRSNLNSCRLQCSSRIEGGLVFSLSMLHSTIKCNSVERLLRAFGKINIFLVDYLIGIRVF